MITTPDYSGKTAVILDDNSQMRAIIRSMLGTVGIRQVWDYSDPEPMMRQLQSVHVDIAILDLVLMASTDGLAVAERIRNTPEVVNGLMPIIMVTGYPSIAVIDQAINVGIDELVTKPLRARDLIARVSKCFDRPRRYIATPSSYYGPDRRRNDRGAPGGEERRHSDLAVSIDGKPDARRMIAAMRADAFTEQRMVDESVVFID